MSTYWLYHYSFLRVKSIIVVVTIESPKVMWLLLFDIVLNRVCDSVVPIDMVRKSMIPSKTYRVNLLEAVFNK